MKVITVINQKGGVGKSTTALALGHGLQGKGYNVLFIDLDAQGNISYTLNKEEKNILINRLKINAPKTGNIRLLQVTENQYNNIIMFSGTKKVEEDISIESLLVFE